MQAVRKQSAYRKKVVGGGGGLSFDPISEREGFSLAEK